MKGKLVNESCCGIYPEISRDSDHYFNKRDGTLLEINDRSRYMTHSVMTSMSGFELADAHVFSTVDQLISSRKNLLFYEKSSKKSR